MLGEPALAQAIPNHHERAILTQVDTKEHARGVLSDQRWPTSVRSNKHLTPEHVPK